MDALQQQIQEAIEKSLPGQVGTLLKGELEALVKYRSLEPQQVKRIAHLEQELSEQKSVVCHLQENQKTVESREAAVYVREQAVTDLEHRLQLLETRKVCAEDKVKLVLEVVSTVFANNTLRTSVMEQGRVPMVVPSTGGSGFIDTRESQSSRTTESRG